MSGHLQLAMIKTFSRTMASSSMPSATAPRRQKEEGDISAVFASLRPSDPVNSFPARFADLKRMLWKEVLGELEVETNRIAEHGDDLIPRVSIESIHRGLSPGETEHIRRAGCVVVKGGIPKEEALAWKEAIKDYAAANASQIKGFPADNIQVYELYNTASQIRARTHPALLDTQRVLLSLWRDSSGEVSLSTPISYFDRLRIRFPGDAKFALGPHVDGGSIERWEDPEYRRCFSKILEGGSAWREYDPFDAGPRVHAKQDLYHAPNQCSIFRPWQGWTAMSYTGPGEGTLRVLPMLRLATAYWILRPFFRARNPHSASLKWEDWNEPDLDRTGFPGSGLGAGQELNDLTHPHLRLDKTMVSMPRVEPGDQVYWHCDMIHAVEGYHGGKEDSSVMYIPAVPLTLDNAQYLRDQRTNFLAGLPAPDFPGGLGESQFIGRATIDDVHPHLGGRRALGFEKFEGADGQNNAELLRQADRILA
ncbi:hypothetical protein B0H10DRAFT_2161062 [Mycena sp. CBHHK59/15]|nr:hypothetical protein B0H10DRAFT_2161062 [Mycena sp. CBHHK59/15]